MREGPPPPAANVLGKGGWFDARNPRRIGSAVADLALRGVAKPQEQAAELGVHIQKVENARKRVITHSAKIARDAKVPDG